MNKFFDQYDLDNNGIDEFEFKNLLGKLLKIPHGTELPPKRLEMFWNQADTDRSGIINFEEFLRWFINTFSDTLAQSSSATPPFEDYYRRVRRVGKRYLDPPAAPTYREKCLDEDEILQK